MAGEYIFLMAKSTKVIGREESNTEKGVCQRQTDRKRRRGFGMKANALNGLNKRLNKCNSMLSAFHLIRAVHKYN